MVLDILLLQLAIAFVTLLDQIRFMSGRQSSHNTRCLINIILSMTIETWRVESLMIKKTFDTGDRLFPNKEISRFSIGNGFICWTRLLNLSPEAAVYIYDKLLLSFSLQRGSRQRWLQVHMVS